jgi:hypothetical protein
MNRAESKYFRNVVIQLAHSFAALHLIYVLWTINLDLCKDQISQLILPSFPMQEQEYNLHMKIYTPPPPFF